MIDWNSDASFSLAGQDFLCESGDRLAELVSTKECFVVGKWRSLIDRYVDLRDRLGSPQAVLELGVFQGGGTAFLALLFEQARLVAVDIDERRVTVLDEFLAARGLDGRVSAHYGIDQSATEDLLDIVKREFADQPLDVVVDDASHLYHATRASFEALFPLLREGGVFVVEDWDWAHYATPTYQDDGGYFRRYPALTNLIVELLMTCATSPDVVRSIEIEQGFVAVERGPASLVAPLRLTDHYLNRGLEFRPLL